MVLHPDDSSRLTSFQQHLIAGAFSRTVVAIHADHVERFLGYLRQAAIAPEAVSETDLARYVKVEQQRFRRRHGRGSTSPTAWHRQQTAGLRRFLAFTQGRWPPPPPIPGDEGGHLRRLLLAYERWLHDGGALAASTITGHLDEALRFVTWLPGPDRLATLGAMSLTTVDRYVRRRAVDVQRSTARGQCDRMRKFLRFLHVTGALSRDLAASVLAPTRYRGEGIPAAIEPEHVRAILAAARADHSTRGLRDYAILMLLAMYGMRAGEVRMLRLDDIDWRGERLWIRHSKTGVSSCVPLLPIVGHALVDYLQRARPPCEAREVFIRLAPPRGVLMTSSSLYSMLRRHLAEVGIHLNGRRGPHAFRHARAASLQGAGVPLKTIGDLLGHRAASSTAEYLKLAEPELRAIALPMPPVSP